MKRVPFLPLPLEKIRRIIKHYIGLGESLKKFFPSLDFELSQSEFDVDSREWLSIAVYSFVNYFALLFSLILIVSIVSKIVIFKAILISFATGISVAFAVFIYLVFYPKLSVNRKVKQIEKNLASALRHLLIQVRSGMPLYNSLVSVSKNDYGLISQEFGKAIKEMNTGKSEIEALEDLARNNPSLYFRRIMWQIINALKTGADIGSTIKEVVNTIITEQRADIKKYGSELNPIALFYMLMVVIFPTLGIVFLIVLSSFIGATFNMKFVLMGILGYLFLIQFLFIGLIKSKRPVGV
jgi:flagellar protein FlaJ